MNTLRLASFGMRGYVGESLGPVDIIDFSSAFATYTDGGRVLVGRDTRDSSPMIQHAVVSGLLSAGCEVFDLGVCPTPVIQFMVHESDAEGAVSVSGGHNGMGWNALALIGRNGAFLEPLGGEPVLDSYHARDFLKQGTRNMGRVEPMEGFMDRYFEAGIISQSHIFQT